MGKRNVDQVIAELTLMDDLFMTTVFSDNIPATELVLKIILDRDDLTVRRVHTQRTLKNLRGHSLTLDVLATDDVGKQYNIEIQNDSMGAMAQRARYHSALIDASLLPAGRDFRQLPETYVVFITQYDVLRYGLPICHIDRTIRENGMDFGDDAHIIYVNGTCQDDTELGKLMQDFHSSDPKSMNYDILRQDVWHYKTEEKGRVRMCAALEEYMADAQIEARAEGVAEGRAVGKAEGVTEGRAAGKAEGKAEGQAEAVAALLKLGAITPEQAALATSLSLEEATRLAAAVKQ